MKRLPVLPALVLAAGGANTATALELGEIEVQSKLGQPLRASIAYALAPSEAIANTCISLAPAASANGMPAVTNARIAVSQGQIVLTGETPIREPLVSARLVINCNYTPRIARDYMLFLDPAGMPETAQQAVVTTAAPVRPAARPQPSPRPVVAQTPVAVGSTYRVQVGDSLSAIAQRLDDRQVGLWQAVNAIFMANPDAFIDGDINRLKAGALLAIPEGTALGGVTAPGTESASPATAAIEPPAPAVTTSLDAATIDATGGSEPVADAAADDTAFLEPASDADAFISVLDPEGETAADATPAALVDTAASAAPADVPDVADVTDAAADDALPVAEPVAGSSSTVWWTLGGALLVVGGLLLFRRRKAGEEPEPIVTAPVSRAPRHLEIDNSIEVEILDAAGAAEMLDADGLDYDLSDDSPTEENLALDANLFEGSGLAESDDAGKADFGFAETTDLDLELTEEAAHEPSETPTDMLPAPNRETGSILESEVLPEEDDYNMSVLMDVTKMPSPEEATERDLKAVVVDVEDKTLNEEGYTLNKEVDYHILEQDYEDELTATQALNREIERAAAELAADLEDEVTVESETLSGEETAALPISSIAELDVTAEMHAGNDDLSATDTLDTAGMSETITTEIAHAGQSTDDPAFDDETAEMDIRPKKVDSAS